MSDVSLMISVGELARRSNVSNRTFRRYLLARGVRPVGHGVLLADIRNRWPELYAGLMATLQAAPACPGCGTTMVCECPVC